MEAPQTVFVVSKENERSSSTEKIYRLRIPGFSESKVVIVKFEYLGLSTAVNTPKPL
jgi:hypothetical protein